MATKTRKTPVPENVRQLLAARYPTEGSSQALADELGVSRRTVRDWAKISEIPTNRRQRQGETQANKTTLNLDLFKTWTSEMAYVLGYIWIAGAVENSKTSHKLILRCSTKDEQVILYVRQCLGSQHKIYHQLAEFRDGVNYEPKTRVYIPSKLLVERLMELGVQPRKSHLDLPFPEVPVQHLSHFVRGYLDGDDWAPSVKVTGRSNCSISFQGTRRFIEGLRTSIIQVTGVTWKDLDKRRKDFGYVMWTGKEDLSKLATFLYGEEGFCLLRKKAILLNWLNQAKAR